MAAAAPRPRPPPPSGLRVGFAFCGGSGAGGSPRQGPPAERPGGWSGGGAAAGPFPSVAACALLSLGRGRAGRARGTEELRQRRAPRALRTAAGPPAPHRRRDGPLLFALQLRVSTGSRSPPAPRPQPPRLTPLSRFSPSQVNALVRPLPASPGKCPLGCPALFAPRGWGVPRRRRAARLGGRQGRGAV